MEEPKDEVVQEKPKASVVGWVGRAIQLFDETLEWP